MEISIYLWSACLFWCALHKWDFIIETTIEMSLFPIRILLITDLTGVFPKDREFL